MKNKGLIILLITLLIIVSIFLLVFMVILINKDIKFPSIRFGYHISEKLAMDKVYNENFKNVYVETDSGDIYVKHSSDDSFRVVAYGDKDKITVDVTDDKLSVKMDSENCIGFCFNNVINKIEIYVPYDYEDIIKVTNNYGDVQIDDFMNASIDVTAECGDVKIAKGNLVNVINNYGDIILNYGNIVNIQEAAGDVKIINANDAIVKNSYGDININTIKNYLNLKNDSGDITIGNLDINKNSFIKVAYGEVEIAKTNKIYIDAKADFGDVKIKNNYHKSNEVLTIRNNCGDINING